MLHIDDLKPYEKIRLLVVRMNTTENSHETAHVSAITSRININDKYTTTKPHDAPRHRDTTAYEGPPSAAVLRWFER